MDSLQQDDALAASVAKAERVTLDSIKAKVKATRYMVDGVLTVCVMEMQNGYKILGKSAPAAPENFNADVGKKFAYDDCIRQVWPLEGYALCNRLTGVS